MNCRNRKTKSHEDSSAAQNPNRNSGAVDTSEVDRKARGRQKMAEKGKQHGGCRGENSPYTGTRTDISRSRKKEGKRI
jgi:hypothetical protein